MHIGITNMGKMQNSLQRAHRDEVDATSRLASGDRLNRAQNDSAALAVSTKLDALVMGRRVVSRSLNVKMQLAETVDGALSDISGGLKRARELSVQAASETYTSDERAHIEQEFIETLDEIDRIAAITKYGDQNLLLNPTGTTQSVHIGIRGNADHQLRYTTPHASLAGLGLTGLSLSTVGLARSSMSTLDVARDAVSEMRADVGAYRTRLESALDTTLAAMESEASAVSKLRDADMAFEVSTKTQASLLSQAAISAIAQAKQLQQGTIQQLVR